MKSRFYSNHIACKLLIQIVAVDDGSSPVRIGVVIPWIEHIVISCDEMAALKAAVMLEWADRELRAVGLSVSVQFREVVPVRTLIEEGGVWEADSIFIGSHELGAPAERSGLGYCGRWAFDGRAVLGRDFALKGWSEPSGI